MNLLDLLASTMGSESTLETLSKKTGVSSKDTSSLLSSALPLLLNYMTNNASTTDGAKSLLGALTQHTSNKPVSQQVKDADEQDGLKILAHIFGKDNDKIVASLAKETGISSAKVSQTLASMAPALLSTLSASTTAATTTSSNKKDDFDLSDLLGMFGGSSSSSNTSSLGNLGSMLSLLGGGNSSSSNSSTSSLGSLMSLLGGNTSNAKESSFDGSDLIQLLSALSKK
ncbi:MAG: DUF937 domain-containing protein [Erysipelotrichaceae bacterium]|jgi:hypothetical protein|nr:DUF937 domain-containing protein [Erysipelotrichaceae bacterium]